MKLAHTEYCMKKDAVVAFTPANQRQVGYLVIFRYQSLPWANSRLEHLYSDGSETHL